MIRNHAMFALMLAGALAACASDWKEPPGRYKDYHGALVGYTLSGMTTPSWQEVPFLVREQLASCMADFAIANVTPAQLKQLDAAARGEATAPAALGRQVDSQLKAAMGETHRGDFSALEPYCPDDIPTFKQYVRY